MHSGYGNILKTNLTLMASTNLHYVIILWAYDVKTSLFSAFLSFVNSFKNQVGLLGLVNSYHFHLKRLPSGHQPGKRLFAYLALELSEVV